MKAKDPCKVFMCKIQDCLQGEIFGYVIAINASLRKKWDTRC